MAASENGGVGIMAADLPLNIRKNLDFFLEHEPEDPDRFGPLILALSERWGI